MKEIYTTKIHQLLNEKNERHLFSIYCETAFRGDFYMELRLDQSTQAGLLYSFYEGRFRDKGGFISYVLKNGNPSDSIVDALVNIDYRPYIVTTSLSETDLTTIMITLAENPMPSVKGKTRGLDGWSIYFDDFINDTTYSYWGYPPAGYEHLTIVNNIIAKYLNERYEGLYPT